MVCSSAVHNLHVDLFVAEVVAVPAEDGVVRVQGRAVVEDEAAAGGKRGHLPVPHHPARGRVVQQGVRVFPPALHQSQLSILNSGPIRR